MAFWLGIPSLPAGPLQDAAIRFAKVPQETIEARLRLFAGKNEDRERHLKDIFNEVGCRDDRLIEQRVKNPKRPNVICRLEGTGQSEIVVGAHFDRVELGDGVVDNWSGAALLPSLFQSLAAISRRHTIVFIGFTDEEEGLVGSEYYVKHLAPEEASRIKAMINVDSIGLGPTKVWLTHSDERLAGMLNGVAHAMSLPLGIVNADQVGDDDSTSFRKKHIPTVMIHAITQETYPILHSTRDTIAAIRMGDYYDTYRLVAGYLSYLDTQLD
jgi:putative aminopeptidase FrvX